MPLDRRTVVVDCTEFEARVIANILDLGAAMIECLDDGPSVTDVMELRDRFLAGIAISQAESILRGRHG